MKKFTQISIAIATLLVVFSAFSIYAFAECPYCDTVPRTGIVAYATPYHNVRVSYSSYFCSPSTRIVTIDKLEDFLCEGDVNLSLNLAIRQLLQDSRTLFGINHIPQPNTSIQVTIKVHCCWALHTPACPPQTFIPCSSEYCCVTYTIAWDQNDKAYISQMSANGGTCTQQNCSGCTFVCNELSNFNLNETLVVYGYFSCFECWTDVTDAHSNYSTCSDVDFHWNSCSSTTYEAHIDLIEYTGTEFNGKQDAIHAVLKWLGTSNGLVDGDYTFRIYMPACMRQITTGGPPYFLIECSEYCCVGVYSVTVSNYGTTVTVNSHTVSSSNVICDPNSNCNYLACNDDNIWNISGALRTTSTEGNRINNQNISSFVRPNPTTGTTDIYLESDIKGILTLDITDIAGKSILKLDINKTGIEGIFHFDAAKVENGMYNYRIMQDGNNISSGKFIVTH